jgi:hypothetical protein
VNTFAVLVVAVSAAASAVFLFTCGQQLGRIRIVLEQVNEALRDGGGCHGPPPWYGLLGSPAGYAIYVYRDGKWIMEADLSRPGYEATPPSMQAAYDGQVVKRESTPKREGG